MKSAFLGTSALLVSHSSLAQIGEGSGHQTIAIPSIDQSEWMRYTILKNNFGHYPDDMNYFLEYFNYCIDKGKESSIDDYLPYFQEAETILEIFGEKASLDEETLSCIEKSRAILDVELTSMIDKETGEYEKYIAEKVKENGVILQQFVELKDKIAKVKRQDEFNEILAQIEDFESRVDKENFTDEQERQYKELTDDYSTLISSAMQRISHNEEVRYNRSALKSFKEALDLFEANKKSFKVVDDNFKKQIGHKLFGFDSGRLFSETLSYYTMVYSKIFTELKDEEQYKLAQLSIR